MYLFSCGLHNTECVACLLQEFSKYTCLLRSALSRANFDGRLSWAETALVADLRAGWRQVFAGGLTTTALVVVHALGADIFCNVQTCICGVILSRTLLHSHGARHNLYWILLVDHRTTVLQIQHKPVVVYHGWSHHISEHIGLFRSARHPIVL